jgi:hypothetical protein
MSKEPHPVDLTLLGVCIKGFGFTMGYAIPVTVIVGCFHGLPTMDSGHVTGADAVLWSPWYILFNGVLGLGFLVLGAVGLVVGAVTYWVAAEDKRRTVWLVHLFSLLTASTLVVMYILGIVGRA